MVEIRLAFSKLDMEFEEIENIVSSLKKCELKIIEDDDSLSALRFVTLDMETIILDIAYDGVTLRNLTKPHLFTIIRKEYLYKLEIRY